MSEHVVFQWIGLGESVLLAGLSLYLYFASKRSYRGYEEMNCDSPGDGGRKGQGLDENAFSMKLSLGACVFFTLVAIVIACRAIF